jgi:hypothetical protein
MANQALSRYCAVQFLLTLYRIPPALDLEHQAVLD